MQFYAANQAYDKMSRAQKRVAIAKDTLALLLAENSRFDLTLYDYFIVLLDKATEKSDVRDILEEQKDVKCKVCAKGALFASKVLARNNVSRNSPSHSTCISFDDVQCADNLKDAFDQPTLDRIECAYEGWDEEGREWEFKYPDRYSRLEAILRRIVRNKGFSEKDYGNP